MKPRTVVSLEQALSLPYATLRFAQLGWRVIRIEPAPTGEGLPGDPNRYIGSKVFDDDRRSYFVAPNVGKEAVAINLKDPRGQAVLGRILDALEVDVFCCNTVPRRYAQLGIDYQTLSASRPGLIWAGISAMGPEYPDAPGYDPVIQAMAGYMEITGSADGPPTLSGVPLVDLKAGDEVYAGVMMALADRAETGRGARIDVSMLQAAASWLITVLPLLDFDCDPSEVTRSGNEHRKFVPTNVYPTRDGFVYIAIGSDAQWRRLASLDGFASLASERRATNAGRASDRAALYADVGRATARLSTAELAAALAAATIPHAVINDVAAVRALPALAGRLSTTTMPDGRRVRMPPRAVELGGASREMRFAPKYGQHTRAVLREAGIDTAGIDAMLRDAVVAESAPAAQAAG